jgi:hypothetical protein
MTVAMKEKLTSNWIIAWINLSSSLVPGAFKNNPQFNPQHGGGTSQATFTE